MNRNEDEVSQREELMELQMTTDNRLNDLSECSLLLKEESNACCDRCGIWCENLCVIFSFIFQVISYCLFRCFCCCITPKDDKELLELERRVELVRSEAKSLNQLSASEQADDPRKEFLIKTLADTFHPCVTYGFKRGLLLNIRKIGKTLVMIKNTLQDYVIDEAARRVTDDIEQGRQSTPILEVENDVYSEILYHVVTRLEMDEEKLQGIKKFCYENREGKTRLVDKDNGYCEIVICFWGIRKRELIYKTSAYKAAINRVLAERNIMQVCQ